MLNYFGLMISVTSNSFAKFHSPIDIILLNNNGFVKHTHTDKLTGKDTLKNHNYIILYTSFDLGNNTLKYLREFINTPHCIEKYFVIVQNLTRQICSSGLSWLQFFKWLSNWYIRKSNNQNCQPCLEYYVTIWMNLPG